jgi:hypothetical protein
MSDAHEHPPRRGTCRATSRRRAAVSPRDERPRMRPARDVCPRRARLLDPDHEAFAEWFVAYWHQRGAELFSDQTEEANVEA